MEQRYKSLEDFLMSVPLTIDSVADDGWGAPITVKGRELHATILFADISGFSERTRELDPIETLIFVNHFFSWITAEAIRGSSAVVDKYIGDEIMLVFSPEFGSTDSFADAIRVATRIGQNDAYSFMPHIGIASGRVIVGHVGTALKYDCSVFGQPVVCAARCAAVKPIARPGSEFSGCSIVFPSSEWQDREFSEVVPPELIRDHDGSIFQVPSSWQLERPRRVQVKESELDVREIIKKSRWFPSQLPEERAKETRRLLEDRGADDAD